MPTTSTAYATTPTDGGSQPSNITGAPDGQFAFKTVSVGTTPSFTVGGYIPDLPPNSLVTGGNVRITRASNVASSIQVRRLQVYYGDTVKYDEQFATGARQTWGTSFSTEVMNFSLPQENQFLDTDIPAGGISVFVGVLNRGTSNTAQARIDAIGLQLNWVEAKTKNLYVKSNGVWKAVDTNYVRDNAAWKDAALWVKHNGVWKKVYGT